MEETGFTVTKWRYCGIVTFVHNIYDDEHMHIFVCTDWTGKQIECNEGDLEWIEKQRLLDLTMWEGDKIFLRLIDENRPFFSLKLTYEVRRVGRALGIKRELIGRHPFPGPSLGIRILGEVTEEKLHILREADDIFIKGLRNWP